MRTFIASLLATTAIVAAAPAFASDDDNSSSRCASAPRDQWMSVEAVEAKFTGDGYKVRQVKSEDGCYEIYAIDKDGFRIEAYVDPVSGEIVRKKIDD